MKTTKSKLLDFIHAKAKKNREDIFASIKKTIHTRIDHKIEEINLKKVYTAADKFLDLYQEMLDTFPIALPGYDFRYIISRINTALNGIEARVRNSMFDSIYEYCANPTKALSLDFKDLVPVAHDLAKELADDFKRAEQVNTAARELEGVIKSQPTADKAYKQLIELGVDMSDFTDEKQNLPAIVELSVPVSVFNGGE